MIKCHVSKKNSPFFIISFFPALIVMSCFLFLLHLTFNHIFLPLFAVYKLLAHNSLLFHDIFLHFSVILMYCMPSYSNDCVSFFHRLFIMAFLSSLPVLLAIFIPNNIAILTISCLCGFILSLDVFSIVLSTKPKIASSPITQATYKTKQWTMKELVIVATMFVLGVTCTAVGAIMSDKVTLTMLQSFGIMFCVLLVVLKLLGESQGVYILWIVRNPLYPRSIQSSSAFDGRKKLLKYMGWAYHLLLSYSKIIIVMMMINTKIYNI